MKQRIDWLDGVKGIGCLIVFFRHFDLAFNITKICPWLSWVKLLFAGPFAVTIFLILCTTSIMLSIMDKELSIFSLAKMIIKRALRLFIPIAFFSSLSYILFNTHLFYNLKMCEEVDNWWLSSSFTYCSNS